MKRITSVEDRFLQMAKVAAWMADCDFEVLSDTSNSDGVAGDHKVSLSFKSQRNSDAYDSKLALYITNDDAFIADYSTMMNST